VRPVGAVNRSGFGARVDFGRQRSMSPAWKSMILHLTGGLPHTSADAG